MSLSYLAEMPIWLFLCFQFALGAIVGSFLNVVIYRFPIMLDNFYKKEAREILDLPQEDIPRFNLILPPSCCRNCNRPIELIRENIPILGYLLLKGKCRGCQEKISPFYPIVELITAILSVFVAYKFGATYQCLFALIFLWSLIALSGIDLKTQLLPDVITLPLLWLGVIASLFDLFIPLRESIIGVIFAYTSLYAVAMLAKIVLKRDAMGFGDIKMFAALAAWIPYIYLPLLLLIACFSGVITAILYQILKLAKRDSQGSQVIPFGPHLALAGFIVFCYGEGLFNFYKSFIIG